jgi:hypothetical protein
VQALRACDEDGTDSPDVCDYEKSAMLLRDVVYMMGRTNDATEDRLFFKMQSVSVKHLQTSFLKAFPTTPWIFVYRDPVQTMMSHWKGKGRTSHRGAVCMRSYKSPKHLLTSIVHTHLPSKPVSSLSEEEFCAAHLVCLTGYTYSIYCTVPQPILFPYFQTLLLVNSPDGSFFFLVDYNVDGLFVVASLCIWSGVINQYSVGIFVSGCDSGARGNGNGSHGKLCGFAECIDRFDFSELFWSAGRDRTTTTH